MLVGGFGPDGSGTVELDFEAGFYRAIAVQPDGKIVLAGTKAQTFYDRSGFASRAHYFLMSKRLAVSNNLKTTILG
jgi:hypothetical protein